MFIFQGLKGLSLEGSHGMKENKRISSWGLVSEHKWRKRSIAKGAFLIIVLSLFYANASVFNPIFLYYIIFFKKKRSLSVWSKDKKELKYLKEYILKSQKSRTMFPFLDTYMPLLLCFFIFIFNIQQIFLFLFFFLSIMWCIDLDYIIHESFWCVLWPNFLSITTLTELWLLLLESNVFNAVCMIVYIESLSTRFDFHRVKWRNWI